MVQKRYVSNKLIFLSAICLFISIFVGIKTPLNEGLQFLFLLPLSFSLSLLIFGREFSYCKDSFGLTILYLSGAVRYVVTPILIALSASTVSTLRADSSDYSYAIIVELFELLAVLLTICFLWPRHMKKKEKIIISSNYDLNHISFRLSWTGVLFVGVLLILLLMRGHWDNIISHLSTWFYRVNNKDDLFGYDMMAFNIIKTVVFLVIVAIMKYIYDRTTIKALPVAFSLVAGLLNTMLYEYSERTDLVVLIITSFFVLSYAFPRSKKLFLAIFGVGGLSLVAMVFMEGTLHYEVGSSIGSVQLSDYSKMAELYTTGPSIIANAHSNYESMRSQVNYLTYLKDFVSSIDVFSTIPFFRFIPNAVSEGSSSVELYRSSIGGLAYIIPNHSLATLYVGDVFCWVLEPIFIVLNVKLLGWFERTMFKIHDLAQVYACISIITMVSMGIFCNNFQLMIHSVSSLPLWLLIFSYINNLANRKKVLINSGYKWENNEQV